MFDKSMEVLLNAPVVFGLKNQGHLGTIEKMINDGKNWDDIANAINWDRKTARIHYERAVGDDNTKNLRASIAESIETLRSLYIKYGDKNDNIRTAYYHGQKQLIGNTNERL